MRIGICDDETEMRNFLRDKVEEICPTAEVSLYQSGEEVLAGAFPGEASGMRPASPQPTPAWASPGTPPASPPDILLLDIRMAEKDGMDTARELRRMGSQCILIFVTALADHVFEAFDVGAFHYLVKPFSDEKFHEILKKAEQQYLQSRCQNASEAKAPARSLLITTGGKHVAVNVDDIVYAEVFNRKIMIHTMDGDIEYYGKMKDLEAQVGDGFYRSHRAYLVNYAYVRKYDANSIDLEKGQALMAKQNYQGFVKGYLRYNRKRGER